MSIDIENHNFDIALSFPGEIRDDVKKITLELDKTMQPDSYFYDHHYEALLARPSLDDLLQKIYSKNSKLIVVFFGKKYREKEWCGIEFRAIKNIILKREYEKIMGILHNAYKVVDTLKGMNKINKN